MTDRNIMDEGIIKDLERLSEEDPDGFSADVLAYINRQNAEIERLRKGLQAKEGFYNLLCGALVYTPTLEAYNKFKKDMISTGVKNLAERLREESWQGYQVGMLIVSTHDIDRVVKELTEGTK